MKSTTLYLIRHGETDWNRNKRFQGHQDIPLNQTGEAQALLLADELREVEFNAVYSSPLLRAFHTAKHLSQEVNVDHRLKEISYGIYDGKHWDELADQIEQRNLLDKMGKWLYKFDVSAESHSEVYARAKPCLDDLVERHPGEKIAIVSHGGLMKSIISKIEDVETHQIEVDNTGYVILKVTKTQYTPIQYCRVRLSKVMKGIS